jgi:hypothetical protein
MINNKGIKDINPLPPDWPGCGATRRIDNKVFIFSYLN